LREHIVVIVFVCPFKLVSPELSSQIDVIDKNFQFQHFLKCKFPFPQKLIMIEHAHSLGQGHSKSFIFKKSRSLSAYALLVGGKSNFNCVEQVLITCYTNWYIVTDFQAMVPESNFGKVFIIYHDS
jgi:hypothetical protein